ncbi:MAG: hypothetical protein P4K98_12785 [Bryobacteraceae bacterium]|nr:hypothetical protein [Bryobacteraceae bacterium]
MTKPVKPSAETKKIGVLIALVLTAGVIYFWPSHGTEDSGGATPASTRDSLRQSLGNRQVSELEKLASRSGPQPAAGKSSPREFKPSMKQNAANPIDTERFDPTLRTDMLDRLADVQAAPAKRSLFDFYIPPATQAQKLPEPVAPVVVAVASAPPPRPPIQLHFYGHEIADGGGVRRVFCELNDQVMIPSEGAVLQRRYKIRRILPASVVIEDLEFHDEQTLPIEKTAKAEPPR